MTLKPTAERPELVVLSTRAWAISAFLSHWTPPLLFPPLTLGGRDLLERMSADILYIRLHGLPKQPYLYGDPGWATALSIDLLKLAPDGLFAGTAVFMEGCYSAGWVQPFLDQGASVVVGNRIATWGHPRRVAGSSLVGKKWVNLYKRGHKAGPALFLALKNIPSPFDQHWVIEGDEGATIK